MQLFKKAPELSTLFNRLAILMLVALGLGLQPEPATAGVIDLSVSSSQVCLLDDANKLKCKTHTYYQRLIPPDDVPELVSLAVGDVHTCGITTTGSIYCFGDDDFGQLSPGDETQDKQYIYISSGANHSCATQSSGVDVDCWGGETDQLPSTLPEYLDNIGYRGQVRNIRQVVMGTNNICWVTEMTDNRTNFVCWEKGRGFYHILDAGEITSAATDDEYYCTIVGDGSTVCLQDVGWMRSFQSVSFDLPEPYSRVAVSGRVVCVLDTNGRFDCDTSIIDENSPDFFEARRTAEINEQVELLSDKRFTHLEAHPKSFIHVQGSIGFCLVDTSDDLHCIGNVYGGFSGAEWIESGFSSDDHEDAFLSITNIDVYGHGIVELFWEPAVYYVDYSHVEIYRDGTLLTTTRNADSYFDSTLEGNTTYTYKIREVHSDGTKGEFSDDYAVRTPPDYTMSVGTPDGPTDCDGGILPAPIALHVLRYGVDSGEVFWQRDMYPPEIRIAYNLFINGTQVNATPFDNNGSYYLLGSALYDDSFSYSLNAVDGCGRVSDMSNSVLVD